MKVILALAVLAVIAAVSDSSVIKDPSPTITTRANLSVGVIGVGDRLLNRSYIYRPAALNTIQYEDAVFLGNSTNRITAVQAFEVGVSQGASAHILRGGLGQNNVTVRFTSARGLGYYYDLNIWGR